MATLCGAGRAYIGNSMGSLISIPIAFAHMDTPMTIVTLEQIPNLLSYQRVRFVRCPPVGGGTSRIVRNGLRSFSRAAHHRLVRVTIVTIAIVPRHTPRQKLRSHPPRRMELPRIFGPISSHLGHRMDLLRIRGPISILILRCIRGPAPVGRARHGVLKKSVKDGRGLAGIGTVRSPSHCCLLHRRGPLDGPPLWRSLLWPLQHSNIKDALLYE